MRTEITTRGTGGLIPQNFDDALKMAELMARSTIVPKDFQGNPGNILVAIQWGAEVGLAPIQAMQNIAVINGRPCIWGDAMLALVRGSGLLEWIREETDDRQATCAVKRKGEPESTRRFSLEDAKRAGLVGKSGPWTQYPKRMLQMRARAWALRDVFPDVLRGIHIAEEAQDIPPERIITATLAEEPIEQTSRTELVKARLRSKRQHPTEPAVTIAQVLARIEGAETEDDLMAAADFAGRLAEEEDKAVARSAYTAKSKQIRAASEADASPAEPGEANQDQEGAAGEEVF